MGLTAFLAMVRKDLLLFMSDRRAVIVAFAVPIFIGSFIGSITGSMDSNERPRVRVVVVDEDGSALSKSIVASMRADQNLNVTLTSRDDAKDLVSKGTIGVGVILGRQFGEGSMRALAPGGSASLESVFLTLTGRSLRD